MGFELPVPSFTRLDRADMRQAGRDPLSLALMDARNQTLFLASAYEQALADVDMRVPYGPELNPPLWELGHVGWFQERWIGRNLQRHRGPTCDPQATGLPSVQAQADLWWDSSRVPHASRWQQELPSLADLKVYLLSTLECTLDLLSKTPDEDDALYFYRLVLFHEDMHAEAFIYMAQTLGVPLAVAPPPARPLREPLWLPATRWQMGLDGRMGFTFDNERPLHEVRVSAFEIDAQPVCWAQFLEFIDDGGYERPELWEPAGWRWLQQQDTARRQAPRHVQGLGHGRAGGAASVVLHWLGQPRRMAGEQPAMHLSWWEADAWCRWAGRRLPTEAEWEVAAHTAARRGFQWGDVWEWTASTFFGYPGFTPDPYRDYSAPWFGSHKVLRGASFATRARLRSPKYRNYFLPERDDIFCGFRSCAL